MSIQFKNSREPMRVLIACESSGRTREAFRKFGHDAWSCDLLESEDHSPFHYQCDVREVLWQPWDLLIAHPECTYLTNSGVHWLHKDASRWPKLFSGADFFRLFMSAKHIPRKAIENPIPHKYALQLIGRKYDQIIHPWQFGHEEMKATCLWLDNLPPLVHTHVVGPPPKDPEIRKLWAKVHRMPPGPNRWKERSRTYQGISDAFAAQWGALEPVRQLHFAKYPGVHEIVKHIAAETKLHGQRMLNLGAA